MDFCDNVCITRDEGDLGNCIEAVDCWNNGHDPVWNGSVHCGENNGCHDRDLCDPSGTCYSSPAGSSDQCNEAGADDIYIYDLPLVP